MVRQDGTAELPLVGIIPVAGLSIVELEDELTEKLSKMTEEEIVAYFQKKSKDGVKPSSSN